MDDLTAGPSVAALTAIPGIGAHRALALARALRTWSALDRAPHSTLAAITTDRLAAAIIISRDTLPREAALPPGVRVLSLLDRDYPPLLAAIPDPPPLIWVRGTLPHSPAAAVVGTRDPSPFGLAVTRAVVTHLLDHDIAVVSGLARGVDEEAARVAARTGTPSWAVLGHGVDILPTGSRGDLAATLLRHGGGLLSEVPPGVSVLPRLLVARNRIQSGLAQATVICQNGVRATESDRPAGTMFTARAAIAQQRVLAVASPPADEAGDPGMAGNVALTEPCGIDPGLLSATGDLAQVVRQRRPAADLTLRGPADLNLLVDRIRGAHDQPRATAPQEQTLF